MNIPSHFGSRFAYFFSSFKNISSIAEHGHFSREEAASNPNIEWEDIAPRGELIDSRKGIEGFISLYFGTHTATQFRHEQDGKKIAFIRYDVDELFQREGAWFTETAYQISKKRWRCNALSENLEKLDWNLINSKQRGFRSSKHPSSGYSEWPGAQAELLLENNIQSSKIVDIVFCSEKQKDEFLSMYGAPYDEFDEPINCVVDDNLFIKTKCRKCNSIDSIAVQNYNRQYCTECEHQVDYSGRWGRYIR